MLDNYRQVLSVPGAMLFTVTGLIARLPISTVGFGIVLLVSERTGSYAYAGSISAVTVVATAVMSPVQGRLMDARGQTPMLPLVSVLFGTGLALLLAAIEFGWPPVAVYACAALTGAALPQIGSLVRARWTHLLDDRKKQLSTAFAVEAVVDEAVFITGPVLVTFLATLVDPVAGLVCAGTAGLAGGLVLAAQRRTAPRVHTGSDDASSRQPMAWGVLLPLCVAAVGSGCMFGAAEVVTVAFASEEGNRSASGVLLALWATASLLSGVVIGALDLDASPLRRFRIASVCLTLALAPLVVVSNVLLAGVTLFASGFAISPMLVAQMSVIEEVVPRARLTEGMSWFMMGMAGGVALGGAASGWVVDTYGASPAYLVPIGAAALAAIVAWTTPASAAETAQPPAARRAHLD